VTIRVLTVSADSTIGETNSIVFNALYPGRTSLPCDMINLMNEKNHMLTDAYTLAHAYKEHKVGRCRLSASKPELKAPTVSALETET
jgi:hypothetical protein